MGLPSADFHNTSTAGAHKMGQHALAITPVQRVYDDLAQATGCLVWYLPTGGVQFINDPWWPKGTQWPITYEFGGNDMQGEFELSAAPVYVDYVILNALSMDGEHHTLRYVYPQPLGASEPPVWAMVTEINDRVLAKDSDAPGVAAMELDKLINEGRTCRLTVKGVGEWCRPGQKVKTVFDTNGDGVYDILTWLIESALTECDVDDKGRKTLTTALTLRGFRG